MPSTTPAPGGGTLRRRADRWLAAGRLLGHADTGLVALTVALQLGIGLLPVAFILATSQLVSTIPDAMSSPGRHGMTGPLGVALLLAAAAFVLQQLLAPFQSVLGELVGRQVDGGCITRLMTCALRDLPVAQLERQELLDVLSDARSGFERVVPTPGDAAAGTLALLARYTQLLGASLMVTLVLGPLPGLLVAATAIVIRFGQRGSLGRFGTARAALAAPRRRLSYLRRTATSAALAKEARVLGLVPWLRRRHGTEARGYLEPLWAVRRRLLFRPFIALAVLGLVGGATALTALAEQGAHGTLSLLQLSAALQAVLIPMRFGVFFPESDMQTLYGLAGYDALRRLELTAAEHGSADSRSSSGGTAAEHGADDDAIEPVGPIRFEGVGFRYHEHGPAVLDGLDLELAPGTSTAIVGLNGAGKTTLVKLLVKLHEPTSGRIIAGGADLAGIAPRRWHRRIAVIFQDFTRFHLTAAENIGLGRPEFLGRRPELRAAAERAGALEVVDGLPHGLDTVLSAQYQGGTDLSGGQWQRIALARALLALQSGASLLVLDEPTAQLDVRAEAAFFERFLEMTQGVTSVIIAHRFSSVRRADRIVVLADGRVAEAGTHEQLMARDGRYAELFRIQAERFTHDRTGAEPSTGAARPSVQGAAR
ncbi:ABC transporter ATP-binding protein [Streptacidiphilus cavernicola]|uniref:ABC transporter ATP-binding protein n=1 Tax=Streptacidiphilus cavernicola TaxID=3342716 RepID=A0ABV6W1B3_9ACTN